MLLFKNNVIILCYLIFVTIPAVISQLKPYKICATKKYEDDCEQVQRGTTEVLCERVQDSIECAMKLRKGEADFGVFSAESTLHIAVLNWTDMTVIKQLRHRDRFYSATDFESVVIVKSDFSGTLHDLKNKKFCHPGLYYGKPQRWSERFLKHFERTVTSPLCQVGKSPAEIEALTLSQFFGPSCRPGKWSHDAKEDADLKRKYKSLCQLCNGNNCEYSDDQETKTGPNSNHQKALKCLKNGGDIAYVSKEDAIHFFSKENATNDYRYLCPDGTTRTISNFNESCSWLKQPWKVIISTQPNSVRLEKSIDTWISNAKKGGWEAALAHIIDADSYETSQITMESPREHIRLYREVPLPEPYCDTEVSWCTVSLEEQEKCKVIRAGGISTGVYPLIICRDPVDSTVNCLNQINKNISDFVGADSNYGFIARRFYNLTAAMYYETEVKQYSSVVLVVRNDQTKFTKFENLKGAKACLPEFGATPSIEFINIGKERKFLNKKECRYHKLLHTFFGDSCAPGAQDVTHFRSGIINDPLCNLCFNENNKPDPNGNMGMEVNISTQGIPSISQNEISCAANETNRYYGNRGALKCLNEAGEVAILELQSLKDHAKSLMLNENKFRIICRNNTLANRPGFDVDLNCALTTIVDGEILVRRRGSNKSISVINVLSALDTYFQSDPDFKMYNVFDGKESLLFKDSTIGLTSINEQNFGQSVQNYIKLFKNIENCQTGGATNIKLHTFIIIALIFLYVIFM